jgi:hypothetical protein
MERLSGAPKRERMCLGTPLARADGAKMARGLMGKMPMLRQDRIPEHPRTPSRAVRIHNRPGSGCLGGRSAEARKAKPQGAEGI